MAPTTTSALHPIVISPVQIPPHFTTLGSGLLYDSHAREPASTLRALLLSNPPLLSNKSRPKSWWRAQCLLYGLDAPDKRTVVELRSQLELALLKGDLEIPAGIVELEHKENGKFRKLNAQVREATGVGVGKSKKAATKDPLKITKSARKVTKRRPAKKTAPAKNHAVTVNLTINMASGSTNQKVAGKKAQPMKPRPKPRAKKVPTKDARPNMSISNPGYLGSAMEQPAASEPKQVASDPYGSSDEGDDDESQGYHGDGGHYEEDEYDEEEEVYHDGGGYHAEEVHYEDDEYGYDTGYY